jgi:hypothetical protein
MTDRIDYIVRPGVGLNLWAFRAPSHRSPSRLDADCPLGLVYGAGAGGRPLPRLPKTERNRKPAARVATRLSPSHAITERWERT